MDKKNKGAGKSRIPLFYWPRDKFVTNNFITIDIKSDIIYIQFYINVTNLSDSMCREHLILLSFLGKQGTGIEPAKSLDFTGFLERRDKFS